MNDEHKTKEQLLHDLRELRKQNAKLKTSEEKRKQAEEALQRAEKEKESILDAQLEHVIYEDTEMHILWPNQAACDSVNMNREELIGRHCYEIWPQRDEPCEDCPVIASIKMGQPQSIEKTTPDGRSWFIRGYPVRDAEGEIVGAIEVTQEITERKRVDEALRESEERFSLFMDYLPAIVFIKDEASRTLYVNKTMKDVLGAKDWIGKAALDLFPKGVAEAMIADDKKTLAKGYQMIVETVPDKHGINHIYQTHKFRIERSGKPPLLGGIALDITERKWAQEELRESEENLGNFFNTSIDFLWVLDETRNILKFNDTVKRRLGYEEDELVGKPVLLVHPPERREEAGQIVMAMLKGDRDKCPVPLLTKDGSHIPVETKIVRGIWNRKPAIFGISRDITELKRSEEEMQKLAAVVKRSSELVNLATLDGKMIFLNKAGSKMLGIEPHEVENVNIMEVIPEHLTGLVEKDLVPALMSGETWEGDLQYRNMKTGKLTDVHAMTFTVKDPDSGAPQFLANVSLDITERKQAEEELRRYREHLEELVEERTRELEDAQAELLRQERLSALGQLTATVAHEIRNPLGTVRTAVFAIGDALERDELHRLERALQLAERNIVRCDNIISELLDYTRERALNLEPIYVDVWLNEVLDEMQSLPVGQNIPESIVCVRELSAGAQIPLDRERLRRAVINVVENAVDALQEESRIGNELIVSTRVVGGRLEIRVSDTGPGIPDDVMEKIFEPLFSTKTYGVGLGLSIVKNIMQQHVGGIEINSKVGQGTTVVLWLPTQNKGGD